MPKKPKNDDPVARLAEYWFRARMMHEYMHAIMKEYDRDIDVIYKKKGWEFETYLTYWLSALFVAVEGFNKLKLKDARVQKLFKGHLRYLKAMRHETYHFSVVKTREASQVLGQMNWAEDLHEALGNFIGEYVNDRADEERTALRAKRKAKRKKKF
jgi:hypothetical protein